jgi:hypothetical protein
MACNFGSQTFNRHSGGGGNEGGELALEWSYSHFINHLLEQPAFMREWGIGVH